MYSIMTIIINIIHNFLDLYSVFHEFQGRFAERNREKAIIRMITTMHVAEEPDLSLFSVFPVFPQPLLFEGKRLKDSDLICCLMWSPSLCIFCGKKDESLTEDGLDLHYWKHCPMLRRCNECKQVGNHCISKHAFRSSCWTGLAVITPVVWSQVVEIEGLSEHLLGECESRSKFSQCPQCSEAVATDDLGRHVQSPACNRESVAQSLCRWTIVFIATLLMYIKKYNLLTLTILLSHFSKFYLQNSTFGILNTLPHLFMHACIHVCIHSFSQLVWLVFSFYLSACVLIVMPCWQFWICFLQWLCTPAQLVGRLKSSFPILREWLQFGKSTSSHTRASRRSKPHRVFVCVYLMINDWMKQSPADVPFVCTAVGCTCCIFEGCFAVNVKIAIQLRSGHWHKHSEKSYKK